MVADGIILLKRVTWNKYDETNFCVISHQNGKAFEVNCFQGLVFVHWENYDCEMPFSDFVTVDSL